MRCVNGIRRYINIDGIRQYINTLVSVYTKLFVILLFLINCFGKGILFLIANSGMLPLFKQSGANATEMQVFSALARSPWAMKPLFGVVCDIFPLGKYNKRYWMVIASLFGIFGCFMLVTQLGTITVMVLFFFCINLQVSLMDLLSEGKCAEFMSLHPETSSSIVVFVNAAQRIGVIIALSFVGIMADSLLFQPMFLIALFVAMVPFFPILLGWLPEEQRRPNEHGIRTICGNSTVVMVDVDTIQSDTRILVVVVLVGILCPILGGVTVYTSRMLGFILAMISLLGCILGGFYAFSPLIAKVALFQILISAGRINIGSAMDYFYTAGEECLPGGPHFSFQYYITYTGLISACISLVTIWLYQRFFSQWNFRSVFALGLGLQTVASLFDFIVVMRWNISIGIPDKVFYILGEAIIENVVSTIMWIPSSTIIGKICPRGLEATVYAFVAGVSNLSGIVADISGAVAFDLVGLETAGTQCNWAPLPWLNLIGHTALPLLFSIPAIWLLPNALQTDTILVDGNVATVPSQTEVVDLTLDFDTATGSDSDTEFQTIQEIKEDIMHL